MIKETWVMKKLQILSSVVLVVILCGWMTRSIAQQDESRLHVVVNLVQLNVAVTDGKNNYVTNLRPTDFLVSEDGIPEKIASFEEGNGPSVEFPPEGEAPESAKAGSAGSPKGGANVFILF